MTGGAGFIGAHVTRHLCEAGHEVVVLDDLSGGFADNVDARARLVEGSIVDHELVNRLFAEERFELVYHLAAYAAEGLSHFIKRFNYTNNVIGSVNLINASVNHEVDCFVFTSSIAVYGANQVPMREDMRPEPEDRYGIAKLAVEHELEVSHEMFGLDYSIFRPHNVYGELQNIGDRYRNVLGIFMNQIMQGNPLPVFGDGEQTRAFSYVGDVTPAIAEAPFTPGARGEVFNVGRRHAVHDQPAGRRGAFRHGRSGPPGRAPRRAQRGRARVRRPLEDPARVRRARADAARGGRAADGRVGPRARPAHHERVRRDRGGAQSSGVVEWVVARVIAR